MASSMEDPELRLVLVGRTGEGKSATGNTILNQDLFKSSMSPKSTTHECKRGTWFRFEREIQVVDTPGMFDTGVSNEDTLKEVVRCLGMTAPGPHAFILVIRPDRFTQEVRTTVDHLKKTFGEGMSKYLILLFTRGDELITNGKSIEDFIDEASASLKELVQSCNERYITFNNKGTQAEKNKDVQKLLAMIDAMVQTNNGVYTNEMYKKAQAVLKALENELMQTEEDPTRLGASVVFKEKARFMFDILWTWFLNTIWKIYDMCGKTCAAMSPNNMLSLFKVWSDGSKTKAVLSGSVVT